MKNTTMKFSLILSAFIFSLVCGVKVFAQTGSNAVVINVAVVDMQNEIKSENTFGSGSSAGLSTADFQKKYLNNGMLVNKVTLVSTNETPNEFSSVTQIPVVQHTGDKDTIDYINAGFSLKATPQIIEDANGNPVAVNLKVEITDNQVDTSVKSDGIPAINRREMRASVVIKYGETAVLGGFSANGVRRYYGVSIHDVEINKK